VGGDGPSTTTWGAAVVWFAKRKRLFTGHEVKNGDFLVGLREEGFRSNGLSLVRKIVEEAHGSNWHEASVGGFNLGLGVLTPSRIYSAAVVAMTGGYAGEPQVEIHGIAHVTGGGIPTKLGRMLKPSGLGAVVSTPFTPSDLVLSVQKDGKVDDDTAYKTWNMGQGMIIATPNPRKVIQMATAYYIDSKIVGEVIRDKKIRISSRGIERVKRKEMLEFSLS
jgi:phosphoribosylformylglycinamidine cyclo-ligase